MKQIFILIGSLTLAASAVAQVAVPAQTVTTFPAPNTAVTTTTQPAGTMITAPAAPTAPTVQTPTVAVPAMTGVPAAGSPAPTPNVGSQLQQLLNKGAKGDGLQKGLAVATILGCTSKRVGQAKTNAYYNQLQVPGKQIGELCKAGRATEARTMTLALIKQKQHDPVTMAATNCYTGNQSNIDLLAGPKMAKDLANYTRWAQNPVQAEREMRNEDICR